MKVWALSLSIFLGGPALLFSAERLDYPESVKFVESRTQSDVPGGERIYILGPETVTESVPKGAGMEKKIVPLGKVLSISKIKSLGEAVSMATLGRGDWRASVYRKRGSALVVEAEGKSALTSQFPLEVGDLIFIETLK